MTSYSREQEMLLISNWPCCFHPMSSVTRFAMADKRDAEGILEEPDLEKRDLRTIEKGSSRTALTTVKHDLDADEAMKAFAGLEGEPLVLDDETNRQLRRKIDLNLMPLLCVIYGLNYLDKTTLSYASIMHMNQDLGLTGSNYSWLGSMFYIGYLAFEWPTNRLLQRLPLAKYSAFNVFMWGLVLALFGTVSNFAGAVTIRLLLGMFEAAVTPGFALFTSQVRLRQRAEHWRHVLTLTSGGPRKNKA